MRIKFRVAFNFSSVCLKKKKKVTKVAENARDFLKKFLHAIVKECESCIPGGDRALLSFEIII